jgi:hypothetical protein
METGLESENGNNRQFLEIKIFRMENRKLTTDFLARKVKPTDKGGE